jgi:hypothetical protein
MVEKRASGNERGTVERPVDGQPATLGGGLIALEKQLAEVITAVAGANKRCLALEEESAALKKKLAVLEANVAPPPAPISKIEPEGVRISYPVEAPPFTMPTDEEFDGLQEVVLGKYPQLAPAEHAAYEFSSDFRRAFRYVAAIKRSDKPNGKYGLGWWIDYVATTYREGFVRGGPFIAAVIAQGDVAFVVDDGPRGHTWEFGLVLGAGRKGIDAWRNVLAGKLLPPATPDRPSYPKAPVEIRVLD